MKKIVFFFRKGVIAKGDFSLYYRVADYVTNHFEYDVYCVNNSNAELQTKYLNTKIKFCDITKENLHVFEGATFVAAFNQLFFLTEEIEKIKDAKILLLFLHPQITNWLLTQVNSKTFDVKHLLKLVYDNKAYGFMDKSNILALQKVVDLPFKENYFPVTLEKNCENYIFKNKALVKENEINIAWLGRLDKDKIYSVINLLDNMMELKTEKTIKIHLIGDGDAKSYINISNYAGYITFVFTSFLYNEDRDDYICRNADLIIAMGISALDVALLGLPTIIPMVSPVKFREDKFVFLYDIKEYSLGWNKEDISHLGCPFYSIQEILDAIYQNDNAKNIIGKKCYDFISQTFKLELCVQDILNMIDQSELTLNKLYSDRCFAHYYKTFNIYKKFRKKFNVSRNFNDYLMFRSRLTKVRAKNGIFNKLRCVLSEIRYTLSRKK